MVYARQKNGTLNISVDEKGLHIEADLSSTQASRDLYDSIMKGLIDKMSFAFVVAEDEYDRQTHTRTISRIGKVYDVSAVSIPANPDTDIEIISARSYFDGEIEKERAERLEAEKRLKIAKLKFEFM
jgi:HK97 family phage prohead protease